MPHVHIVQLLFESFDFATKLSRSDFIILLEDFQLILTTEFLLKGP